MDASQGSPVVRPTSDGLANAASDREDQANHEQNGADGVENPMPRN
jgi:hypothetical protein